MKKTLLFIVALASVVVGCTKSEVVKAPGRNKEIKFATYVGKTPVTKAMSGDLAYLQSFTSEQTPSFHVNAFIHTEVERDEATGLLKIDDIYMSGAYMDKDVWWASSESQLGIPTETDALKVIFSEAVQQPTLDGAYAGNGTIPTGWTDAYSPRANWYATSALSTSTAEDGTVTSEWGAWVITAITSENNSNPLGTWDYPGTVYWPDANSSRKLAFSAYSLNVKNDIEFKTTNADGVAEDTPYSSFTYTVPQSVAAQNDLLVTPLIPNQGISATGDYTTVGLTFKHVLSRIGFSLIANRDDDDIKILIKSVTLNGSFPSKGTVNLHTLAPEIVALTGDEHTSYSLFETLEAGKYECCEWSSKVDRQPIYATTIYVPAVTSKNEETGEETVTEKEKYEANANPTPANRYMMLIPTELGEDAHILVTYQLTDADEQTAKISLASVKNFEAGKSYDFVFKVSTSAIGFYVEVSPWDSYFPTEGNSGIYTLTPEIVG